MRSHWTTNTERLGRPDPTWRDIKQLAYVMLLVVPLIAVVCYGAAGLVGPRAAFWIGVGLVTLTGTTFALLVAVSFLITYADDAMQSRLHGHRP